MIFSTHLQSNLSKLELFKDKEPGKQGGWLGKAYFEGQSVL